MIRVIPFDPHYRDDMIFMVLLARDALGIPIRIREDLLDVQTNYLDRGDGFWLAVNDEDRVVGCVGYNRIGNSDAAYLHRFFVKPSMKRRALAASCFKPQKTPCEATAFISQRSTLARLRASGLNRMPSIPNTVMRLLMNDICKKSYEMWTSRGMVVTTPPLNGLSTDGLPAFPESCLSLRFPSEKTRKKGICSIMRQDFQKKKTGTR